MSESITLDAKSQLSCRFYTNELPDLDEVVLVKIKNITEAGIYVTLLEYNNKEGK